MSRKGLHIAALVCFAIAVTCYLRNWIPATFAVAAAGLFFEVAACSLWLLSDRRF
jgi:hypothetical protein